jgi:hypothetical protein
MVAVGGALAKSEARRLIVLYVSGISSNSSNAPARAQIAWMSTDLSHVSGLITMLSPILARCSQLDTS